MIGFKVYDVKGEEYLGEITEIMDTAAHDIYVIGCSSVTSISWLNSLIDVRI